MKQGELFQDLRPSLQEDGAGQGTALTPEERLAIRLTLDKVIFIVLAGLILLIVVFTFGVEHGKKLGRESLRNQRAVESITNLARITAAQKSFTPMTEDNVGKPLDKELIVIEGKTPIAPSAQQKTSEIAPTIISLPGQQTKETVGEKAELPQTPEKKKTLANFPFSKLLSKVVSPFAKKSPARSEETSTSVPVKSISPEPRTVTVLAPPAKEVKPVIKTEKGYEVRIMSVANESYGQKEIEKLNKAGVSAALRKSGNYHLVTLGVYNTRQEADAALKKARAKGAFKDAYIRRIT